MTLAFVASVTVHHATHNALASGYAAAWAETIGYAGVLLIGDLVAERRAAVHHGRTTHLRGAANVVTGLLAELGPAGAIDTFITRPFAMAAGVRLLGPVLGLFAGKIVADAIFYVPVIYAYERRKMRRTGGRAG